MKHLLPRIKLLSLLAMVCFAFEPSVHAVDPPPDGGYPKGNTAEGEDALLNLGVGELNTALGFHALTNNRKGNRNTAVGANAMETHGAGADNTAVGVGALANATHTDTNTAVGSSALGETTTGYSNTAMGFLALWFNTTGYRNTASGMNTLSSNTTGNNNTGYGYGSLLNITTGSNNIALGANAGWTLKTGSNNIDIGANGDPSDSNTIRIGERETHQTTYIAGISGATVADGVTVVVGADGHLGTMTSSERYKDQIKPMDNASEAILALKPVTFRYKHDLDPEGIPQFGLVAEQVEKVNPDLVVRDEEGNPYSVRYEAVNAMLLNEFLKEHRGVQDLKSTVARQEATIAQQQREIQTLTASLKEQGALIQKVSERLDRNQSGKTLVADN